jgi:hypothetical protein
MASRLMRANLVSRSTWIGVCTPVACVFCASRRPGT